MITRAPWSARWGSSGCSSWVVHGCELGVLDYESVSFESRCSCLTRILQYTERLGPPTEKDMIMMRFSLC